MAETDLTLHEAAAKLGVHYMTAYRYVRLGLLPAHKSGGVWQVSDADLAAFHEHQDGRGTARQALTASSSATSADEDGNDAGDDPERSGRLRAPWAERIEVRLVAGDGRGAWGVVEAALAAGSSLADIYLDVLTPALASIGERWMRDEIDIAIEHRASSIAMRLIGRLGPRFVRRGRSRGIVVLGCPAGERHVLSVAMVADLVRQRGWEVSELGADLPPASFVHAASEAGADLVAVGISVSGSEWLPAVETTTAALRSTHPGVIIVIGGRAVADAAHAQRLGADHFAGTLTAIGEILEIVSPNAT